MTKRLFDILFSLTLILLFLLPSILIYIVVKLTSKGPVIFWSDRVGRDNVIFKMPKFRTMKVDTPNIATHLIDSSMYLTPVGSFLRKSSIDELPQLWSILIGDMSVVGPRPALFNQYDLIGLRTTKDIHRLKPGLTGWAQINGRDELSISDKVLFDFYYYENISFFFDLKIIIATFFKTLKAKNISH